MRNRHRSFRSVMTVVIVGCALEGVVAQSISFKREQAEAIVDEVAEDVRKTYYDPKLNGVDWDTQRREAKKKIEHSSTRNETFANIAAMLDSLNDSLTYFIPPDRQFSIDYGWRIEAIGERCFVTHVRPETDAASKVHPGDEVLAINDYTPTRANIHRIGYLLKVLRPQSKIQVTVRSITGEKRQFEIVPKIFPGQFTSVTPSEMRLAGETIHESVRPRFVALDGDVLVAKIPFFQFLAEDKDRLVTEARRHRWLILDLRGNPGGTKESLAMLASGFFDRYVTIADAVRRKTTESIGAKPDRHPYLGKLTVLVDGGSVFAAELFARVIQLEKRGIVIGDRTAGMVMEADRSTHFAAGAIFGVSITTGKLIMSDGKSLEGIGVLPDELALPAPDDLANGDDPVLAHAAEIAGAKLSPKDAAELFPYQWEKPLSFAGH